MPWLPTHSAEPAVPVYTRAEGLRRSRMPSVSSVVVLALVLALTASSLGAHVEMAHHHHHHHHHHPVDMQQWSIRAPGDVRCYCNLPACITTGYMCKSAGPGRGCFSDLVDHVDVYRARHGCLDLLDGDRQRHCKNQPRPDDAPDDVMPWERDAQPGQQPGQQQDDETGTKPSSSSSSRLDVPSLLLCCTEDMCNHIESPDSRMRNGGSNGSDASHVILSNPAGVPLLQTGAAGMAVGSSEAATAAARSAELWFKAATIAVPICGALIVVVLIVLAVRLLRADSQHQRASKLSACAFPPLSDKKVPLLPCGTGVGWGHGGVGVGVGVNRLGLPPSPSPAMQSLGLGLASDCSLLPPKNHTLAKLNYSASYDLLDKDDDHHRNDQRNVLLEPAAAASNYEQAKQALASFVPWSALVSSHGGDNGDSGVNGNGRELSPDV